MTVMLDSFFGIHPHVIRSGLWAKMKPGEKDLYVYLMHESERCRTRSLTRTNDRIREAIGLASRTACDARKRLQEHGLIRYQTGTGNRYVYVICNPRTGEPYPGDPRTRAPYEKGFIPSPQPGLPRLKTQGEESGRGHSSAQSDQSLARGARDRLEVHGQPLDF